MIPSNEIFRLRGTVLDSKCIETHFTHLEEFFCSNTQELSVQIANEQNLMKFIQSKTQLKRLRLDRCSHQLIGHMSKYLYQLDDLLLSTGDWMIGHRNIAPIHFKSVKSFHIVITSGSFPINWFLFDQLKYLSVTDVKLRKLKSFGFTKDDTFEVSDLEKRLENGWRVSSYME